MIGLGWLGRLCDRRRWRAIWVALTFDSALVFALRSGEPSRDAIIGIVDNAELRAGMIALAEQVPEAISAGLFDRLDDWLTGAIDPEREPEPEPRIDPRRFEAMRDAHSADGFAIVGIVEDAHGEVLWTSGTAVLETPAHRRRALLAFEQLADAIRTGALDRQGGRIQWPRLDDERGGGAG